MSLKHTRAIIDAIHAGSLAAAECQRDPIFGFDVVRQCEGVPAEILWPRDAWADSEAYEASARRLADRFHQNFKRFEAGASERIRSAGPVVAKLDGAAR